MNITDQTSKRQQKNNLNLNYFNSNCVANYFPDFAALLTTDVTFAYQSSHSLSSLPP